MSISSPAAPVAIAPIRHDAFALLDKVSQAKVALEGTIAVALEIIEANADEAVAATLERLIAADSDALNEAFSAAWDGLVRKGDAA